jgi:hypothetical protein
MGRVDDDDDDDDDDCCTTDIDGDVYPIEFEPWDA